MLYWDTVVKHWVVLSFHVLFEFENHLQHLSNVSRVRVVTLSHLLPSGKNLSDLLIAFHASVRQGHASPFSTALLKQIRALELSIINIEGKMCVKFVFSDSRSGTLRFTHSDIQKAKLVPDHTMDLGDYRIVPVIRTVSIESHASCEIDSRCHKRCKGTRNYVSTHRDLS